MRKYFKLFANCIITKGYNVSLISDLQRYKSEIIPNDLVEIIEVLNQNITVSSLKKKYSKSNFQSISEYLNYLEKNDFGFYCDRFDLNHLIELNKEFNIPYLITNSIIEYSKEKDFNNLDSIAVQLDKLGCRNITILLYFKIKIKLLNNYIEIFNNTRLESFDIYLKYEIFNTLEIIQLAKTTTNKIKTIIFFDSPKDEKILYNTKQLFDIVYLKDNIKDFKSCGLIDIKYFNTNMPKVLESLNHNSCLNKKISIDKNGEIKNCPSMPKSFGNIKDTTLEEALNHPDFKKYWNITKDQIEVCKDCEFRHICTDCRAYVEEPNNDFSKPLKCGYNPYTNVWEEWSTNPLKQKAIEYYGLREIVKKDA